MNKKLTIGVLGGMGPAATAYFYNKMIEYAQKKYKLIEDYEYPEIIIYNLSVRGITEEGIKEKEKTNKKLQKSAKKVENWGADFIVIPCNTAHYFFSDIQKSISIPVLDIREKIADYILKTGLEKIGICATESSINLNIFKPAFDSRNIKIYNPSKEQEKNISSIIFNVMKNKNNFKNKEKLRKIIKSFKNRGAEGVLLGCTELPLVLNEKEEKLPLFNSSFILAKSAIDYSINYKYERSKNNKVLSKTSQIRAN